MNTSPDDLQRTAEIEMEEKTHRRDFWLLLALFVVFRLLTLFLLRPGGFVRDWSDFDTYLGIASLSDYGLYPFLHYWLEWPPLVPWLMVGVYKLSLLFPVWTDGRLWFALIMGVIFLLFETGNFVLLYRIARLSADSTTDRRVRSLPVGPQTNDGGRTTNEGEEALVEDDQLLTHNSSPVTPHAAFSTQYAVRNTQYAIRVLVIYALLFAPIYALLGFFDAIALFFLLLALDLTLRGRLLSSAVSVGVGFLVKLTPIVFLPVALRRLWAEAEDGRSALRDGALYVVTTALTILVGLLPFLVLSPAWILAAARATAGRSSWETAWAILEGYFGYGVVGGDRLNPAETGFAVHAGSLPWWLITLVFGLLYLLLWSRPADYHRPRNMVALTGLTVTFFLLYSKGYSPQFLVYLLPFILLLFPDARGVAYSLLLTLLNVLEQPVYFVLVPEATWLLRAVVLARWLVMGALIVEFSLVLWGPWLPRLAFVRRYAAAALVILAVLGLLTATPFLGRAYAERRLGEDPAASLVGYLSTEQAQAETDVLLLTDQEMLRRFSPYLAGTYDLRLAGGDDLYQAAPSVADLIAGSDKVWLVASGEAGDRVARSLEAQGRSLFVYNFDTGGDLQLFASREAGVAPLPPVARLSNGVNLIGYTVKRLNRSELAVTLYWLASGTPPQSYTVFAQVLDSEGQLMAGHDSFPSNGETPTETWIVGRVYPDTHVIRLPDGLAAGTYQVVAGMYDFNLNRVVATGADAEPFQDRAVPLGQIPLP